MNLEVSTPETSKGPSKGSLFKKKHGYSKTMKRLLHKYGITLEEYRKLRKEKKHKETLARQAKHKASRIYHAANKKVRVKKSKKGA